MVPDARGLPVAEPAPIERKAIETRWDALFVRHVPGAKSNRRDTGGRPSDPEEDPESPWHRL